MEPTHFFIDWEKVFSGREAARRIILAVVFLATAAMILVSNNRFHNDYASYWETAPAVSKKNDVLRVTIDPGNGHRRAFEAVVIEPITAGDALRGAERAGGFLSRVTLAGDISEIDGVRARSDKKWYWYLNGVIESRPILDVAVAGGDKILLKYE